MSGKEVLDHKGKRKPKYAVRAYNRCKLCGHLSLYEEVQDV